MAMTHGEHAMLTLLDPEAGTVERVAAALHLGGIGSREYKVPLKIAKNERGEVGQAAKIALEIMNETHNVPQLQAIRVLPTNSTLASFGSSLYRRSPKKD